MFSFLLAKMLAGQRPCTAVGRLSVMVWPDDKGGARMLTKRIAASGVRFSFGCEGDTKQVCSVIMYANKPVYFKTCVIATKVDEHHNKALRFVNNIIAI